MSNFHYICELLKLTCEILDQRFVKLCRDEANILLMIDSQVSKGRFDKQDMYRHITQSHLRLVSFYRHLPTFLKISPLSSQPSLPHIYMLQ